MDLLLSIVLIAGPLLLGTYLSIVQEITGGTEIVVWIICLLICVAGGYRLIKGKKREEQEAEDKRYYQGLLERQELRGRDLPTPYINGLGENPLLKHSFDMGQRYEKESKFNEAIEEYKKCLSHPKAIEENKVAANVLIGDCYYVLSKLKEAENHYKEALDISKRVKDKGERLQGRAAALGNIGLIYIDLGKPDEALKYLKEALEIDRKIGYEQGRAAALCNIGVIYSELSKPDEALKYLREALETFKRIGAQRQIGILLENISDIEEEKRGRTQQN